MKISKKLFIGFIVLIIFAFVVGMIGIGGMERSHKAGQRMYDNEVMGLEYTGKAIWAFKQVRIDVHNAMINSYYDDFKGATDAMTDFEKHVELFEQWMNNIYVTTSSDEIKAFHDNIMSLFYEKYLPKSRRIIKECVNDIPDHAHKLHIDTMFANATSIAEQMENLFIGMTDLNTALAEQANVMDGRDNEKNIAFLFVVLIVAVVSGIIMTVGIVKSIEKPIDSATKTLSKIAQGDFTARMEGDYKGVIGVFKDSLNSTGEQLSDYLDDKIEAERIASASEAVFASMEYASKIQRNLLPNNRLFDEAFSDYSILWEPRDIVGGDIYWIDRFEDGVVLCVGDCTGHGTPGAMLTMLVTSVLQTSITEDNYKDTSEAIWQLEQALVKNLDVDTSENPMQKDSLDITDGCDIAVLYIADNKEVTISSVHTNVFICNGENVIRIKGEKVSVGEGRIRSKDDVRTIKIEADEKNKFYVASDGIFDQVGEKSRVPFGYKKIEDLILDNHGKSQTEILDIIWETFEQYRGKEKRRDDIQLITFKP